ncbi:MAG: hypothetical protein AAFR46_15680, partial [Pseudomonadota bacterium]
MAAPALSASVPTSWAVETRIAEVEIRAAAGLLISGNDLELLDPETGENRLRLILFDGARRFSAAFAGTRPMVLIIEVRELFSARGFGPDIYALELAYRLEAQNAVLATSAWRSIEHRIPDIGEARTSLAAAVQRDLSDWMTALDCTPDSCATRVTQTGDPDPAAVPETGPVAADAPPPRPEQPTSSTRPDPDAPDPARTNLVSPDPAQTTTAPVGEADRPRDTVAALLRHERRALQSARVEPALRDGEGVRDDAETAAVQAREVDLSDAPSDAPSEVSSDAPTVVSSDAPTVVSSEAPADPPADPVVIAAPGPDATPAAAREDLTPTAQARAEASLPRPRPARQAPTPRTDRSPSAAVDSPQPGLGEARWIGSTDAAPADPTGE